MWLFPSRVNFRGGKKNDNRFPFELTMRAFTSAHEGVCRSRGWCCGYVKLPKLNAGWGCYGASAASLGLREGVVLNSNSFSRNPSEHYSFVASRRGRSGSARFGILRNFPRCGNDFPKKRSSPAPIVHRAPFRCRRKKCGMGFQPMDLRGDAEDLEKFYR